MKTLTIGELAELCQVNLETLRYYERLGLMPEPPRSSSGHRAYPTSALTRVHFIRRTQSLGFSLAEIAELLTLRRNKDDVCTDVVRKIEDKREEVDRKIADLELIRRALLRMKGSAMVIAQLENAQSWRVLKRIRRRSVPAAKS